MNKTDQTGNLDELVGRAGKALGTSENEVRKAAQSGDIAKLLGKLTPAQAQQLKKALSDENAAKKLLSTPAAQALLKGLKKNE